jgi:serine/threonine protein kinase
VLLFELTTGKRLFKGGSEYETLRLICEKEYPLPTVVKPGYPQHLERIVMRALAKRREDRYQSAREMQQELEEFIREERIKVSNVSLMNWMQMLFEAKLAQQKRRSRTSSSSPTSSPRSTGRRSPTGARDHRDEQRARVGARSARAHSRRRRSGARPRSWSS